MTIIKNRSHQPYNINIGNKLTLVGSRATIELSEKDIESSPQIQELLARKTFQVLAKEKPKPSTASSKASTKAKDKPE